MNDLLPDCWIRLHQTELLWVYLINEQLSVFSRLIWSNHVASTFHFITENPPTHSTIFWALSFMAHLPVRVTKELPWIHFYTSIKPGVPFYLGYIASGRFALAGIQGPHHDRRSSDVCLSSRNWWLSLFLPSHCGMFRCSIRLSSTNRCHSGMNCRELSPKIGKTATEGLPACKG